MNGWSFFFLDMQRREDIVDHSIAIALQCLSRAAAYMQCTNKVVQRQQRMVRARWLPFKHIHARRKDLPRGQRLIERLFIDDTTAGRVDEDQVWIGLGKDSGIEHVLRALRQRDVDADKVHRGDQRLDRLDLLKPSFSQASAERNGS